jgi:hypothetical protein
MMGGLWGNKRVWEQIKTGTIHWQTPDGDIAWLMILGDGKTNVKVSKTQMSIFANDTQPSSFEVFIYTKNITTEAFNKKNWNLSGMTLNLETDLKILKTEVVESKDFNDLLAISENIGSVMKVTFEIPSNWKLESPLVKITPNITYK